MLQLRCKQNLVYARFSILLSPLLLLWMLYWGAAPEMRAQTTFGSISGAITDSSSAAMAGVHVTLTDLGTSRKSGIVTGREGLYQFVDLNPGQYRIEAEMPGFQRLTREPVVVLVGAAVRIDMAMQVGAVNETVSVTAETPLLQPETSSLGEVITGQHVTNMPLNGRNVYNLMVLVPSVIPQGSTIGTPTGVNSAAWNNYQINGGFAGQSAIYLDGAPMNMSFHNNVGFIPSQDAIQEFKVQTDNLGPEWGRFAGGVMNLSTKAGTNQIHGGAYEFLRNKDLNANTFFSNTAGVPRPPFTQNQFGANAGGPVYLPHVYDGRNKTFWFVSWEGFRLRQGQTFLTTVPTAAERAGDFSNLRDAKGNLIPVSNPFTVCGQLGNPACATGANGQPVYTRTPFSGNMIPGSLINPASAKLENLWPLPNLPGQPFTHVNDYIANASTGGNNNGVVTRIDQSLGDKQRLFVRVNYWNDSDLYPDPLGTGVCVGQCFSKYWTKDAVLGDTVSFSPTTVADFRLSYLRYRTDRYPKSTGFDLTSIGWPAFVNAAVPSSIRVAPTTNVQGEASEIFSTQGMGVLYGRIDVWDFSPSVTKIIGPHTLQMGGSFRVDRFNYAQTNIGGGYFNFDNAYTASAPLGGAGGFGFASYLLGTAASGQITLPTFVAGQQIYRAEFIGDTWRATRRLTLNLGLRWEQQGPWTERYDRLTSFAPGLPSTLQVPGLALHGQFALVNSSVDPHRSNFALGAKQLAPRVGYAYQLTPKTVLRGGYGIFWIPNNVDNSGLPNNDSVNTVSTAMVASLNGGITPLNVLSNPFPTGISVPSGRPASPDQFCLNLGACSAFVYHHSYGYMQQWNFDVQRELPAGVFVDVAYAGAKGTHLPFSQFANQLPDQYLAMGNALLQQVANPFFGLIQSGPLSASTVARGQLLRPYPQYNNFNYISSGFGSSSYNSLQLKVRKRFKAGGTALLAYTKAKLISNVDDLTGWLEAPTGGVAGIQNWNDLRSARTLSSDDIPQRLVLSYAVELPFGNGQKFLSRIHGVAGKLASGWGVDGITTLQSGFPLKFKTTTNQTGSFGGGSLPNVSCASQSLAGSAEERLGKWFNTSCFSLPPPFTFGNESRVDPHLRQQGIKNFDFTLRKTTNFGPENKIGLQFRAEFFNIFNRPQFGPPNTVVGVAQFGIISSQVNNPRLIQLALRCLF